MIWRAQLFLAAILSEYKSSFSLSRLKTWTSYWDHCGKLENLFGKLLTHGFDHFLTRSLHTVTWQKLVQFHSKRSWCSLIFLVQPIRRLDFLNVTIWKFWFAEPIRCLDFLDMTNQMPWFSWDDWFSLNDLNDHELNLCQMTNQMPWFFSVD